MHIKNRIKKIVTISTVFIILISALIIATYFYFYTKQSQVNDETSDYPIIYQNKVYQQGAMVQNDQLYLSYQFIFEYLDSEITYDEATQSVIIVNEDKIFHFQQEKLETYINKTMFEIEIESILDEDGQIFIEVEQLRNIYPIKIEFNEEYKSTFIFKDGEQITKGLIKDKPKRHLRLKTSTDYFSNYYGYVSPGEEVFVESENDKYIFVRLKNGVAGYVKKDIVEVLDEETIAIDQAESPKPKPVFKEPINLTWEAVYSKNPDTKHLPELPGVNVVSPTWFKLKNEDGDIHSLASMDYVNWAKENKFQIWGLFSNDFDPDKTHVALENFETRQKMIRQLLQYSEMYQLDGINVDFENVYLEDKEMVTQFMRELTALAHQAELIISMDITFISSSEMWSMFYDREQLSKIVDYMIVMAYDEHWATSPQSGSVASFPWVEVNLAKLLEVVPNDRLILGIPTYTRIWKEQETEGGNIEVSSKALSMQAVDDWIAEKNVTPVFDYVSRQDYVEFYDKQEKATYKIWIENADSIGRRAQMVHEYQLAGVATWNRFFANEESWEMLNSTLNQD